MSRVFPSGRRMKTLFCARMQFWVGFMWRFPEKIVPITPKIPERFFDTRIDIKLRLQSLEMKFLLCQVAAADIFQPYHF